ncbi:MAG: hypothetical protein RB191_15935 [Terriglobia bacterium]|nr:hypothetical protein [Terriglobia bacterium]
MAYAESVTFGRQLHEGHFDKLLHSTVRIIPFEGRLLGETRRIDFLKALGQPAEVSRIIAFGKCNMSCPYCARDAQSIDAENNVRDSVMVGARHDRLAGLDRLAQTVENAALEFPVWALLFWQQ